SCANHAVHPVASFQASRNATSGSTRLARRAGREQEQLPCQTHCTGRKEKAFGDALWFSFRASVVLRLFTKSSRSSRLRGESWAGLSPRRGEAREENARDLSLVAAMPRCVHLYY